MIHRPGILSFIFLMIFGRFAGLGSPCAFSELVGSSRRWTIGSSCGSRRALTRAPGGPSAEYSQNPGHHRSIATIIVYYVSFSLQFVHRFLSRTTLTAISSSPSWFTIGPNQRMLPLLAREAFSNADDPLFNKQNVVYFKFEIDVELFNIIY